MEEGKALSFEEALAALEAIVQQLEDGALDLNEAIQLYQQGHELAKQCQRLLDTAALHVQRLGADGPELVNASTPESES